MSGKPTESPQLLLKYPSSVTLPDPRSFSSPTECAHYCVDNCGLQQKAIAFRMGISQSLLTQKLHGLSATLGADEYQRIASALIDLGAEPWSRLMFQYFAVKLLPPPGRKEKLRSEWRALKAREQQIIDELGTL